MTEQTTSPSKLHVYTYSNALSFFRLLLAIPIFIGILTSNTLVVVCCAVVGLFTDYFDGWLARKLNEVSEAGKIIDPIADKVVIAASALALVLVGSIPLWFILIVIVRDVVILLGGIYIRQKYSITLVSTFSGKLSVTVLAFYFLLTAADTTNSLVTFRLIFLWASIVIMAISFAEYALRFRNILR